MLTVMHALVNVEEAQQNAVPYAFQWHAARAAASASTCVQGQLDCTQPHCGGGPDKVRRNVCINDAHDTQHPTRAAHDDILDKSVIAVLNYCMEQRERGLGAQPLRKKPSPLHKSDTVICRWSNTRISRLQSSA